MQIVPTFAFLALAAPAFAEGPRVTAAVGLIDKGKGGMCSGVLIEPDLVLTAAHCLFGEVEGKPVTAEDIHFRTGAYPAHPSQPRRGVAFVRHPLFLLARRAGQNERPYDVGLLRLESPVPPEVARPLAVRDIPVVRGETLLLASFPRGQGERARERRCPVLAAETGLLLVECVVVSGESGSPVLWHDGESWVVGAVMVATTTVNDRPAGLAVRDIPQRIEAMLPVFDPS